jgi:hypothetical protein
MPRRSSPPELTSFQVLVQRTTVRIIASTAVFGDRARYNDTDDLTEPYDRGWITEQATRGYHHCLEQEGVRRVYASNPTCIFVDLVVWKREPRRGEPVKLPTDDQIRQICHSFSGYDEPPHVVIAHGFSPRRYPVRPDRRQRRSAHLAY